MNHAQPESTANAVQPAFPPVVIEGEVAVVTLRSANGYEHPLRCPVQALEFLRKCWPFQLIGGNGRKYAVRNGVNIAEAYIKIVQDSTDIYVHAPNGWLDWTSLTFTRDDEEIRQEHFEKETSFNHGLIKEEHIELALAHNRPPQSPEPEPDRDPNAWCTSADVAAIFAEAQIPQARPVRTTGLKHLSRGFSSESEDAFTRSKIRRV